MTADAALADVVRQEWGSLIALLLARFRRLDLVEDALADAVEAAARRWPVDGVPDNPAGWLHTTARNRILDRLRAEAMARRRHALVATDLDREQRHPSAAPDTGAGDDVLRLVLMCTHPALSPPAASALALRLVLGVSTADIARLFLVSESTMAARLTRARKKIVAAAIPFAVPGEEALAERLETVAQTTYLAFTAGYAPASGSDLLRAELAGEAVRLARLTQALQPRDPTLIALRALVLLQHSRRDARVRDGALVLLADQDRTLWRHEEIEEALVLLTNEIFTRPLPAPAAAYLLQARIAAEHANAATAEQTRWDRIVGHYDMLLQLESSPAAQLARAVAVAEDQGPAAGLAAVDQIDLRGSHRVAAVRAELLVRSGRTAEAAAAFDTAISLCANTAERVHLTSRRARLRE